LIKIAKLKNEKGLSDGKPGSQEEEIEGMDNKESNSMVKSPREDKPKKTAKAKEEE
jgi:hypothetical protein